MLKKGIHLLAYCYTFILIVMCFISSSSIPSISSVRGIDKVYHLSAHFVFAVIWCMAFLAKNQNSNYNKAAKRTFLFSLILGVLIEIGQGLFTLTRSADIFDVCANVLGSVLGLFSVKMFLTFRK